MLGLELKTKVIRKFPKISPEKALVQLCSSSSYDIVIPRPAPGPAVAGAGHGGGLAADPPRHHPRPAAGGQPRLEDGTGTSSPVMPSLLTVPDELQILCS